MTLGLLLLADSRLPAGGHGHSGGVEALVDRGLLGDEHDLSLLLRGRLRTGAAVPAAAAALACALAADPVARPDWARWEAAVSARLPAVATREASWAQGAALLRTAGADLEVMRRDADAVREGRPTVLVSLREQPDAAPIAEWITGLVATRRP